MTAVWRVRIRAIPYRLPFVRPLATAKGILLERRGFWIVATDEEGHTGFGEVAPLPDLGIEAFQAAKRRIASYTKDAFLWMSDSKIRRRDGEVRVIEWNIGHGDADPPAVRAGIGLALHDIAAQRAGVRVCDLLGGEAGATEIRTAIPVNALLREIEPEAIAQEAASAVAEGYGTLKVKVGGRPPEEDIRRLQAVRDRIGYDVMLRADANGSWDLDTAIRTLRAMERLELEYVEQPVASDLAVVRERSPIRIAADESACSHHDALSLIEEHAVDVLVLKPMALGDLRKSAEIIGAARRLGIDVVVTSVLDTAIGVAGALHLAATLPESSPACGLATLDLFKRMPTIGLGMPLLGIMPLLGGTGLGVQLRGFEG